MLEGRQAFSLRLQWQRRAQPNVHTEQLNYSQGNKGYKTPPPAAHSECLVLFPSCLPCLAWHLLPLQNHGDVFFHGPSISKPAAEDRLTSLPMELSQMHPFPPRSSFDPSCPPPFPPTGHPAPVTNSAAVLSGGT